MALSQVAEGAKKILTESQTPITSLLCPSPSTPQAAEDCLSERQSLLGDVEASRPPYYGSGQLYAPPISASKPPSTTVLDKWRNHVLADDHGTADQRVFSTIVGSLPAVVLGALVNILNALSYGMIIFPAGGVFANLGGAGVSMFLVSATIAQIVYSAGGSGFTGANGNVIIEVLPFFHSLADSIAADVGEDNRHAVLATTIASYALSSIMTGLVFFLLGGLRIGSLMGFFPRHLLVGCIGGIGVFLIITGFTVCTPLSESDFDFSLSTFKFLVLNPHNLALWGLPFGLAVLLRIITSVCRHQLIFPLYFLMIPVIFHVIVAAAGLDLDVLRANGWLLTKDESEEPWYEFYTFYDFGATHWSAIWSTLPTQCALLFFNLLHPPLNVPALAISLNQDLDTDRELVGHGFSNLLAGVFGTLPNYLPYANTLMLYRVGATTRIAGFLLAAATASVLFIGTGPMEYIPVAVVGALIFVLGIDLVKEALWDTRKRVSWSEYFTIVAIMICMAVYDFVVGIIFGVLVSCFFFVVHSSRRQCIRGLHTGDTALSTARRPSAHRAYLREVTKQTSVLRLQGFLFFGNVTRLEETIRTVVGSSSWLEPTRFLLVDLTPVAGVDMSATEAFVRVQRLLAGKGISLIFAGVDVDSPIGRSLANTGLLETEGVEIFSDYADALEWTENTYLRTFFVSQKVDEHSRVLPGQDDDVVTLNGSILSTPRTTHLLETGYRTIARVGSPASDVPLAENPEPYNTLVTIFSTYGEVTRDSFLPLIPYLERMHLPEGYVLWEQGEPADGLYIVESGILVATYHFAAHASPTHETIVAGTLAGDLSGLSETERDGRCVVERRAVVWKLSREGMRRVEEEQPEFARRFAKMVLKAAKSEVNTLFAAMAF